MEISHSKKFVFIHIPKTAGTSVAQILHPHADTLSPNVIRTLSHALGRKGRPETTWFEQHDSAKVVHDRWGKDVFSQYYSFSFVRNPYDHAISHYNFTRKFRFGWARRKTIENLDFQDYLEWRIAARQHQKMERRTRFVRMPDQSFYLYDDAGEICVNKVFKVEDLPDAITALCEELDIAAPTAIPHARQQKSKAQRHAYLNAHTISLIERLYERDFVHFSYQKLT